ncbi:MAG: oligopeptide transporter, OPT family [Planctomycetota bacterium]|nr:oligopeptide transporter, OPT family [Planctomycetota bacterium]
MSSASDFKPAVAAHEILPEFTFRAVALGALLGIVFGAASTYLGLRVGLTTSASEPIAVLAAWAIRRRNQQRAVLEHNIVQTTGSAGESVAAAVVFTLPALIFLGFPLQVGLTTLVAITGGCLGVLLMVPLRRYLIVEEHGVLRYPEGKACAEIILAGEKGGTSAKKVFIGLGFGAFFKAIPALFGGVKASIFAPIAAFKGASVGCDVAPELMGVGYIIGYRTSLMMVAGSVLASFVLVPMIVFFAGPLTAPLAPASDLVSVMTYGASSSSVWANYVKHIGAGAVAAGGVFALLRATPAIVASIRASAGSLFSSSGASGNLVPRTDRDTPTPVLVVGALAIVAFIWAVPAFQMNLLGAVLILVIGFLFAVVSSRVTGEVGSSSCPLSGMTIGVLMATCGIFLAVGWEGSTYSRLALIIGAIICIAISNAGTCSQDLKTGYLLGATPVKQQGALLIGVVTSVLAVGWTTYLLNAAETKDTAVAARVVLAEELVASAETIERRDDGATYAFVRVPPNDASGLKPAIYLVDPATREVKFEREDGIGAGRLQAPQAKLMSVVIDGLLEHRLPWDLILIGVAIAIFIELLGFRSLTFAVGVYLPLASTMPVFLGGLVRLVADKRYERVPDAEDEPEGVLWCSGLIAGASILGIGAAMLGFLPGFDSDQGLHPAVAKLAAWFPEIAASDVVAASFMVALCVLMFRGARPSTAR